MDQTSTTHVSVLLHEVVDGLTIQPSDVVIDGTLGGGGHTRAIADRLSDAGVLIGFDADHAAIVRAQKRLEGVAPRVALINQNVRHVKEELAKLAISSIDKAVLDLGLSSDQLDISGRGFSFKRDEPLTMTFSVEQSESTLTAAVIVNEWSEESIADILFYYGGEIKSRVIAKAIVAAREEQAITTSRELAEIIEHAIKQRKPGIHPATRSFQALRIAVNDELGALKEVLPQLWELLTPSGRIAIISFHSLEDRIVKRFFREQATLRHASLLTKKPISPSEEEVAQNPRARSAKLRIIEKL